MFCVENPGKWFGVIAPTHSDLINTIFEGESGLLSIIPDICIKKYVGGSQPKIFLWNGSVIRGFSAEKPGRMRGPNLAGSWLDEMCEYRYDQQAWDQMQFANRKGTNRFIMITTTPKPTKLLKRIVKDVKGKMVMTTGVFDENAANLNQDFVEEMRDTYAGTRLGRQELNAEILDDRLGKFWNMDNIDMNRVDHAPADMKRIVIGVDPSGTKNGDETGIVGAGLGANGRFYILDDSSVRGSPHEWATRVCESYSKLNADRVIAEGNFGMEMVERNIRTVDPNISYRMVRAKTRQGCKG